MQRQGIAITEQTAAGATVCSTLFQTIAMDVAAVRKLPHCRSNTAPEGRRRPDGARESNEAKLLRRFRRTSQAVEDGPAGTFVVALHNRFYLSES